MNLGSNRWKSNYICDKCGEKIRYIAQKGFVGINHYYKSKRGQSVPYKNFDLCDNCEKRFREWINTKEIPTMKEIINTFQKYDENKRMED